MQTDKIFRFNGNVINKGYITNLPDGCCVEVPMFADKNGLHPVGGKAAAAAGHVEPDERLGPTPGCRGRADGRSRAAVRGSGRRSAHGGGIYAEGISPGLVAEILEAQRRWLPRFAGKSLRTLDIIPTPAGLEGVAVPLDPALAIVHGFGKLADN